MFDKSFIQFHFQFHKASFFSKKRPKQSDNIILKNKENNSIQLFKNCCTIFIFQLTKFTTKIYKVRYLTM